MGGARPLVLAVDSLYMRKHGNLDAKSSARVLVEGTTVPMHADFLDCLPANTAASGG